MLDCWVWIIFVNQFLLKAEFDVVLLAQELESCEICSVLLVLCFVRVQAATVKDVDHLVQEFFDPMFVPLVSFDICSEAALHLVERFVDEVDVAIASQLLLLAFLLFQLLNQKAVLGIQVCNQRIPFVSILDCHS